MLHAGNGVGTTGIDVRLAGPKDAHGIARCFSEAYGASYPNPWATDPALLSMRVEEERSIFAVALERGVVVGATALEPRADGTGDLCHAAVLPSHRRLGLFSLMNAPLVEKARGLALSALFGRCVTSHPFSQRAMASLGSSFTGLSLSVAPRSMRFLGIQEDLTQREACFDSVLLLESRPCSTRVHVPPDVRFAVSHTYAELGVRCEFERRAIDAPRFRISSELDRDLGIATVRFASRGPRPARTLDEELSRLETEGAEALFAELPLASPATAGAVEALRDRGFSFAAVLPGRGEGRSDALRLQRPLRDVTPDVVAADLPGLDTLRLLVFQDRAAVTGMPAEQLS